MLIKLFKLQFSSFNVPFKKILIFYRQMSEIKTWVFRGEANERLKETDFAGEINIMFMWLFFFLNWLNHFVLMLVRVSCWLGWGWCAPARWPGISRVTSAWIAHESPSSKQHKSLHYTAQGFDPAFPTKAAPALPSFPCTTSEEQNVPNEQCLAKNMFRFKGKGNKPNVSLELSSGNHRRSDTGFSLLSSLMFPLDSKSPKILKWPLTSS